MARESVFSTLARDLRCATWPADRTETPFSGRTETNSDHRIDVMTFLPGPDSQPATVTYRVQEVEGTRCLVRSVATENESEKKGDERDACLATEVDSFSARYFDGRVWANSWAWDSQRNAPLSGTRGLPLAVEIRLVVAGRDGGREAALRRLPLFVALLNRDLNGD
jgi:hypothetical protein